MFSRSASRRHSGRYVVAWLSALTISSLPAFADSYDVSFSTARSDDDGALRKAEVVAQITPDKGVIRLSRYGDDSGLYHQWATFVLGLKAENADGEALDVDYIPHGQWRIVGWRRGEIKVTYSVLLQHDRFPNDPGDNELAVAKPYGVMWTGRALFLEGAPSDIIEVNFNTPETWRVTTPWSASDAMGKQFLPANTDELLDSAFFAGDHDERRLTVAGIETRIASDPKMNAERQLFEQVLSTYLPAYADLFENDEVASPLIIALPGSFWGGGVMGRTISLTHGGELNPAVEPMVKYIVGHEVFHLWNAQWRYHDRKEAEIEWIKEGSAEYFTWLTALRVGDIPPDVFFAQIGDRWNIYKEAISTQSIASAGKTKLENQQSYDLVYSGGMMLVLALDLIIREDTSNEKSLDDVMAYLQEYNSGADGIPLTVRTLQAAIKQSTRR